MSWDEVVPIEKRKESYIVEANTDEVVQNKLRGV